MLVIDKRPPFNMGTYHTVSTVEELIHTISRPQERVGGAIGQNAIRLVQR